MFIDSGTASRVAVSKRVAMSAIIGVAVLATTGTVAMATTGGGPETASADRAAVAADRATAAVLASGGPLTARGSAQLAGSSVLKEAQGDLARAREIKAPAGAVSPETWIVIPSADSGACLSVDGAKVCGSAVDVESTGIAGMQVTGPSASTDSRATGLTAIGDRAAITGFGPLATSTVVAIGPSGKVTAEASVAGQAYRLTVPTADLTKLQFRNALGAVISEKALN